MNEIAFDFLRGLTVPLVGLRLIMQKKTVRRLAVLPIALTAIVFVIGIIFSMPLVYQLVEAIARHGLVKMRIAQPSFVSRLVHVILDLVAWPAAIFLLLFSLFIFSRIVALPFYALLAERALVETGLKEDRAFNLGDWVRNSSELVVTAFCKLAVFVVLGTMFMLMSFIPGLGLFAAVGFLLLAAFDVVDITFDALRFGLKKRFSLFFSEFPAFAGLAMSLGLVFLIPGLNFLLFPAAVAGSHVIIRRQNAETDVRIVRR